MAARYLLYIDILGFAQLVSEDESRIHDLYEVIASLNVHQHDAFRAVVFSDTILVYNSVAAHSMRDKRYFVMFLCEFAQDLMHRLVARDIVFRAVLVRGEFTHYELNSIPCFFGPALVNAYRSEKETQAIGLFISKELISENEIFSSRSYNDDFDFVYVTQSLQRVEEDFQGAFPVDAWLLEDTDEIWHIVPEVLMLRHIYSNANSEHPERIKLKYQTTWQFYEKEYPRTVQFLLENHFDVSAMAPSANWDEVLERYPADYSWAVDSRTEF